MNVNHATPAIRRPSGRTLGAALGAISLMASAMLSACSGPGGVELGDDWAGSETFVLSTVSGLTTVVGINPVKHHAQPLLVVPQHSDDDPVLAPQITRLASRARTDAAWLVSVPRAGDRPSRLYSFTVGGRSLDAAGDVESLRSLVPNGPDGLAGVGGTPLSVLRYRVSLGGSAAASLAVRDDIPLGADSTLTSGGPDGVCSVSDAPARTVLKHLVPTMASTTRVEIAGIQATALDCSGRRPVIGGTATSPQGLATPSAPRLVKRGGIDVVLAGADQTVGRVLATPDSVIAAVYGRHGSSLVLLPRAAGAAVTTIPLPDLPTTEGLASTPHGYVVTGNDQAAVVSQDLSESATFPLPAELTAAP